MTQPSRSKIMELEVMVADVIQEAHDTTTLVLFTGNDHMDYLSGHFLTIDPHQFEALGRWIAFLEDVKDKKELPRAYSMASAPDEHYLAITVKEERYVPGYTKYPPLLSPILAQRTATGRKMLVTGFTGPYTLPKEGKTPSSILHIAAGSGIVPNWSILKFGLRNHPEMIQTLLYSNKTWLDTIYGEELIKLQKEFPDQLDIKFFITRENPALSTNAAVVGGRIDKLTIEKAIEQLDDPLVYVCGPANTVHDKKLAKESNESLNPRFMESTLGYLSEIGIDKSRIKRESYG